MGSIDKQVRELVEYDTVLRNMKRVKIHGVRICPWNYFRAVRYWAGAPKGFSGEFNDGVESLRLNWRKDLYYTHAMSHLRPEWKSENPIYLPKREAPSDSASACGSGAPLAEEQRTAVDLPFSIPGVSSRPKE
jgi:hypothetical protein